VQQGGHNIAEEIVRRRFAAGMHNFLHTYRRLVSYWQWVDNSIKGGRLIEEGTNE